MDTKDQKKELIEKQFQEILDRAKELYPNIDEAVSTLNNITARTINLQDYLNLTQQTPIETSNNQISFS